VSIALYRLPEHLEKGSGFGPSYKNVIQEAISGNEQRFAQWTKCRGMGDISYPLMNSDDPLEDFKAVVALFRAHFGTLIPFRFKDWSDYTATDEVFGTGNGTATDFQLTKTYDPSLILLGIAGTIKYIRDITLPVSSTVTIKSAGVTQAIPADCNISASGLVTFTSAPGLGTTLTWSGEFDVPVRFDSDQLPVIFSENDLQSIRSIPIREVIGES
jgi:uncharacterized protein (TIGR02217 family)